MAETTYSYTISTDFPKLGGGAPSGNGVCNSTKLDEAIRASSIVTALNRIDTNGDDCDIVFNAALSVEDKTILDGDTVGPVGGIIASTDNTPSKALMQVDIENFASVENTSEGHVVPRVVIQPGRTGYYMCDRDIRVSTAIVDSSALEDLKVNPSTNKQEPWGEVSLVGCYKMSGADYIECVDQADADTNAVLTIFDYLAINQTTDSPIEYDFKGGALWSDASLTGDLWKHRMYAVMAPNLPVAIGGGVRFFDGYLYPYQGKWQEAVNTLSLKVDPSQSVEAARIRFWIFYPEGAKQNHVLRVMTYRKPETN